ncbi:MAG: LemA family protein [Paludibacteraceae bacterium]|nr:LemA family protein [Paludibacteraceae bacterium]
MKKNTLTWILVIGAIALLGLWMMKGYNAMVVEQENVENAWGQVEASYQHRMDLIPSLAKSVEAAVKGEMKEYTSVMEARAKATQVVIDPSNMTEEQLRNFQQTQGELTQALNRLMVVAEAYPELKASEQFNGLRAQLEGVANRITVARKTFNDCAQVYNTLIRRFPNNIVAGIFGFTKRPYFEAEEGAEKAPELNFNFD